MIHLPDREFVLFDLETTDTALADTAGTLPEMVEIGMLLVDNRLEVLDQFECLVQPISLDSFTEFSEGLTHIRLRHLEKAKMWAEVWKEVAEFTKYNRRRLFSWGYTDIPVLKATYKRAGLGYPHNHTPIDVISLLYGITGERGYKLRNWKLDTACKFFGIDRKQKHRALPDTQDMLEVMRSAILDDLDDTEFKLIEV